MPVGQKYPAGHANEHADVFCHAKAPTRPPAHCPEHAADERPGAPPQVPAGHAEHDAAPPTENEPAGHSTGGRAPPKGVVPLTQ